MFGKTKAVEAPLMHYFDNISAESMASVTLVIMMILATEKKKK